MSYIHFSDCECRECTNHGPAPSVPQYHIPRVRKPDPAPIHEAMRRLGATHGWMVGDSANDVGAARNAGMPSIVVRGGYNHGNSVESLDPAPDLIIDSLAELPPLLRAAIDAKP